DATSLEPERFAAESDPEWAELNQASYEWCASLLAAEGCPTLPYDGHLSFVGSVLQERETAEGDNAPASRQGPSSLTVALFSVESETLEIGDRLPVRIHPAGTDPREMLAGLGERRHFFLAIRPRRRLAAQYDV